MMLRKQKTKGEDNCLWFPSTRPVPSRPSGPKNLDYLFSLTNHHRTTANLSKHIFSESWWHTYTLSIEKTKTIFLSINFSNLLRVFMAINLLDLLPQAIRMSWGWVNKGFARAAKQNAPDFHPFLSNYCPFCTIKKFACMCSKALYV